MSLFLRRIQELVSVGDVRVSKHGYQELEKDGIDLESILISIDRAEIVEEYPSYHKGHCVLVLQADQQSLPIHVLWGSRSDPSEAVLITSYRPDPVRWTSDFKVRIR